MEKPVCVSKVRIYHHNTMPTINQNKTAVTYCRVSTDEQAKEGLSIEAQERICNERILRDGYTLLPALKDEGKSGKDMNRPAIRTLIQLIHEKKVQAVYVVHSDRIGRNVKDYLIFQELLKSKGAVLISINEPMIDNESAMGLTVGTMMMTFSQLQRLITAEKVQGVMREIAKEGYFPTYPPTGYYNTKNPNELAGRIGRKIIATDPVSGPLVTETFHRYARGDISVAELSDIMHVKGLRNRQGSRLQLNSLYNLLRNRLYLGEIHWGGIDVLKGKHEPLIDQETFDRVQMILEEKNKHACRRRKYVWLLAGLVTCPRHGRRYAAEWHMNKKKAYYHCTNPKGCGKYIEHTVLEDAVADKFRDIDFSDEFVGMVIDNARQIFLERRKKYDAKRQGFVNRRTGLESKRKIAEEKLFSSTLSDEDFTRIRKELQTDIDQINNELLQLEDQREVNVEVAREILLLTRDIYAAYKKASPELQRQYLLFFWERFEVVNGVIISAIPAPLFDALLKLEAAFYRSQETEKAQEIAQNKGVILHQFLSAQLDSNQRPSP